MDTPPEIIWKPYLRLSYYALDFWQPLLGRGGWALYLALLRGTFQPERDALPGWSEWQPLRTRWLARRVGAFHRTLTRPGGYLEQLEGEGVVVLSTGPAQRPGVYVSVYRPLPLLTPRQAARLPRELRDYHAYTLRQAGVYVAWLRCTAASFIPPHGEVRPPSAPNPLSHAGEGE